MRAQAFLLFAFFVSIIAAPAAAAETWICPSGSKGGEFTIDGNRLLTPSPAGTPRGSLSIVKSSPDVTIALSEIYAGDRVALIMIDRKNARYKIRTVGVSDDVDDSRAGPCTKR